MPAPCPNTSNISLWNILRNNIGKDLSKVAMPVQLNEPLNTLQRLCEELEYSELLDKAAQIPSALERMVRGPSSPVGCRGILGLAGPMRAEPEGQSPLGGFRWDRTLDGFFSQCHLVPLWRAVFSRPVRICHWGRGRGRPLCDSCAWG